jgi:hypothetical protein
LYKTDLDGHQSSPIALEHEGKNVINEKKNILTFAIQRRIMSSFVWKKRRRSKLKVNIGKNILEELTATYMIEWVGNTTLNIVLKFKGQIGKKKKKSILRIN